MGTPKRSPRGGHQSVVSDLAVVTAAVHRLTKMMEGNGQKGLFERLVRAEENMADAAAMAQRNQDQLGALAGMVASVSTDVSRLREIVASSRANTEEAIKEHATSDVHNVRYQLFYKDTRALVYIAGVVLVILVIVVRDIEVLRSLLNI